MAALTLEAFRQIAAEANLAPSVHNTQPARWRLDGDGAICLLMDRSRQLRVGDPELRDAQLSCGAALEGTRIALRNIGLAAKAVEYVSRDADDPLSLVARIEIEEASSADPLAKNVSSRITWRRGFTAASPTQLSELAALATSREDVTVVSGNADIDMLADVNDAASLGFFRDRPYRKELLHWMRLSPAHPGWDADGMNAAALGMNRFEAMAAGLVLGDPVFGFLDKLGLSSLLVSEGTKTRTASAVVLFHRGQGENPVDSGIAFYRLWLSLTALGLAAWPMAVIADNPDCRTEVSARFKIPADRRLVNLLRVGVLPDGATPGRARLPAQGIIV